MKILTLLFTTTCFFTVFAIMAFAYGLAEHDFQLILQSGGLVIAGLFIATVLNKIVG